MFTTPLSSYLAQTGITFVSPNTANWRGYHGTWEIKGAPEAEQRLYLVKLAAHKSYEEILSLTDVFPGFPEGVFAHWFTGTIRCPQGNQLKYVHMGYASTYEYDFLMEIEGGVLIRKYARRNSLDESGKTIAQELDATHSLPKNQS